MNPKCEIWKDNKMESERKERVWQGWSESSHFSLCVHEREFFSPAAPRTAHPDNIIYLFPFRVLFYLCLHIFWSRYITSLIVFSLFYFTAVCKRCFFVVVSYLWLYSNMVSWIYLQHAVLSFHSLVSISYHNLLFFAFRVFTFFCVVLATGNLFTLFCRGLPNNESRTALSGRGTLCGPTFSLFLHTRPYIQGSSLQQGSHPPSSCENTLNNFKYSAFNLSESAGGWNGREALLPSLLRAENEKHFLFVFSLCFRFNFLLEIRLGAAPLEHTQQETRI